MESSSGLQNQHIFRTRQQQGGRLVGDDDGVIIVDHGSRRKESNLMLDEFVKMFKEKTKYPIVEPAHMELAKPSIEDAFSLCVQKGAKRIIVSPFFLSPGRHWTQDIPSLAAAAAKEHPGVSYLVTAPLGLHELLVDVMNDRITHCLSHVSGDAEECLVCAGTGKCQLSLKMFTSRKKIHKDKDAEPTEFEESVAQALFDLENTNQELKSDLKDLYINSAVQIDVSGGRKAVVIHVPYRLRKAFRKIHVRLVRELEKKFSGKDVILIATRRILRPPKKGSAVQRPRTRTLTAVHDAILEDVVVPAEIVGKRVRYRIDGSKIMKVFLDPKERNNTEYKLETFAAVYRKLAGKDVVFEYPMTEA
ncbi:OLC1v1038486C1 [Oldenlandia corymbosa var. corymbosa]|uniref:OLC1v1038486C1 n=1 Tax=Oldenlandia corymbosa var. corymbosa TaxID=529605 RepID=A0AAV1D2M6_OLDCO|nr:OLC1v1038486C1 [Oldenlandia corymbosa var. corymbosa]